MGIAIGIADDQLRASWYTRANPVMAGTSRAEMSGEDYKSPFAPRENIEQQLGIGVAPAVSLAMSLITRNPVGVDYAFLRAGEGAKIESLTANQITRIQNAADRTGTEISLVGSRAKGTAGPMSDWDYVVPESTTSKIIHSLTSSLPEGWRGIGDSRNQDIFRGVVDKLLPYITFTPRGK